MPVGAERIVSGTVDYYSGMPQMAHPDYVVTPEQAEQVKPIEPVYPLTAGLSPRVLSQRASRRRWSARRNCRNGSTRRCASAVIGRAGTRRSPPRIAPQSEADLAPRHRRASGSPMTRSWPASWRSRWSAPAGAGAPGGCWPAPAQLQARAEAGFGFALTGSQRQALAEIAGDMKAPQRMMRLLQGDVGSGKTVVALLAMLMAVESGAPGGA